jgi:hypothetical protein
MIAVFDNFIQDPKLLKEIQDNHSDIFKDPGNYKYWNGWWNGPANNTTKKIMEYVWGTNCPISKSYSIDGFEYWTGIQTAKNVDTRWKDNLGIHLDKDEALWKETGEKVTPVIGSIYYPPGQDFKGGDLVIYTDGQDSTPETVKAKPNRFIIFGAGQHSHAVTTVTGGIRHAIAINLWENEPYSKQKGLLTIEQ